MKNKKQIIKQIAKLQKELEEIEVSESKPELLHEINFNGKKFKIYRWEDKPFGNIINKDFTCKFDKKLKLSTFDDFNDLIENKKINLERWKVYVTKHFNRLQWNRKYCLSGCCLFRDSNLDSWYDDLSVSYSGGRVVLIEVKK